MAKSGVGIGLSNSKCLVEALAGTIDLQSKPDKGTIVTFSVDLVLKKASVKVVRSFTNEENEEHQPMMPETETLKSLQ